MNLSLAFGMLVWSLLVAAGAAWFGYDYCEGRHAKTQVKAQAQVIDTHDKKEERGHQVEKASVKKQAAQDQFFDRLEVEAAHATNNKTESSAAAECVLDAERLRIWRAANAGAEAAGVSSFDRTVPGFATAAERTDQRSGTESPTGGAAISPM